MKTIIAGSRGFTDRKFFNKSMEEVEGFGWGITRVVSGTARGADQMGEKWAEAFDIPIDRFPAEWDKYSASAGHIRNAAMADAAEALVAFWDGRSPGTKSMIWKAVQAGLWIKVFYYGRGED